MSFGKSSRADKSRRFSRHTKRRAARKLSSKAQLRWRAGLESLEDRRLLSALPPYTPPANDALYNEEWNLNNTGQVGGTTGADVNILPAWQEGYTGKGVTVGVVDSGVYYNHPDLSANYNASLSYNYFNNTTDAEPPLGPLLQPFATGAQAGEDSHGTEVAGIIAGTGANGTGSVGEAPNATIASERIITFDPTGNLVQGGDPQEYDALTAHNQQIAVYNNSWGFIPQQLATTPGAPQPGSLFGNDSYSTPDGVSAMQQGDTGITPTGAQGPAGRGGLGNIYVWAAGNSNFSSELAQQFGSQYAQYAIGNTNDEAETASRFADVVAALGPAGQEALYSDPGASILVSAPGGYDGAGAPDENGIPSSSVIAVSDSTSPSGLAYQATYDDDGTYGMNGTSAATPAVSGIVALMLQANPNLSWRDVQEILAESAVKNDPTDSGWTGNGYGYTSDGAIVPVDDSGKYDGSTPLPAGVTVTAFHVNNKYGFGEVNAGNAVNLAKNWTPLQPESSLSSGVVNVNQAIPDGVAQGIQSQVTFTGGLHVEHVEVDLNITSADRGDIQVTLTSPNGTVSVLQAARSFQANGTDYTLDGTLNSGGTGTTASTNYTNWATSSVQDWGESSAGTWTVTVSDMDANGKTATFGNFTLKLFGAQDYAPIAQNTSLSTAENTPGSINLLASTYDTDGTYTIAPGSLKIASQPAGGTVTVNPQTGQVTYTPNPNFYGTDSFTYTVTDTNGVTSRPATVTVTVGAVNAAPVANNVTTTTSFETPVAIPLLTDVTPGTGTLVPSSVTIVSKPSFGTVAVNQSTGSVTYTPGPNFSISDSFTYEVKDSNGLTSNVATVTIDLAQPAPVANNVVAPPADLNVTQEIDVLASVVGGANPASVTIVTGPQNGIATVDPVTGLIAYTPAANFFGSDSLTFNVKNFQGVSSNLATVSVNVLDLGAPLALNHEFVLLPGETIINGFRAIDNPTNTGTLTAKLVTQAQYGTVTLNADGTFTYVQTGNSPGLDTFAYQVNNGMADSNVATIRLVSQNFHYVEKLYQQLLNRTASDANVLYFTGLLNAGVSRSQIVGVFLNSNEYLANFVNASYQKLLHRSVDPAGLAYWINEMQFGLPAEVFLAAVASSPEYIGLHGGTTVGQIEGFYQDFLNRGAATSEIDYWFNLTKTGVPPSSIVLGFDTSPEYRDDLVSGYYVTYLGNAPDPNWVAQYVAGLGGSFSRTAVQEMILSSDQYFTS